MGVLANLELEHISPVLSHVSSCIPEINLSDPASPAQLVKACQDFGFFKLINHGIQLELITELEEHALRFFSQKESDKEREGLPSPFGYGSKTIGPNGDVGWVEYLLFEVTSQPVSHPLLISSFRNALNEYLSAVRKLAVELLEMMAYGLGIQPRNALSRLVSQEGSDQLFRINHYPPWPQPLMHKTGFGEHTDPQIISVLRSNHSTGLQIALKDGSWLYVPPDPSSFFINVGDTLQVLTNGRFRSVKHRVLANGLKSRVSMTYFGGPRPTERIAPLEQLMAEEEESLSMEFTWEEYKRVAYKSRLSDNRLARFKKIREGL